MSAHAEMGPSGADRWMTCTSSVALIARLRAEGKLVVEGDEDGDEYSAEGTAVHDIRARCLEEGLDPYDFVGKTIREGRHEFEFTEEMAERLTPGIDWLRERLDEIEVELRVRLDPWMPNQFGTLDSGGFFDGTLVICDYKNGIGEPVDAVDNRQLRLYALGYWHRIGRPQVQRILIVIDQPRAGGMKFWEITINELLAFGREASDAFLAIKTGNTEFKPSRKACRWCPAKETAEGCPAYTRWMLDIFLGAFDKAMLLIGDVELPDPDLITPEKRWFVVQNRDLAKKWLEKLYADSLAAGEAGNPDPGSKVILGRRGDRFLRDEKLAEKILFDALGIDAYKPTQLIGITDIEKALKPTRRKPGHPEAWERIQELIDRDEGKPTVVSVNDPRPALMDMDAEFEDLD